MKLNNIVYSFSEFASAMAKLHDEKHFDYLVTIIGEDFGEEGLGCIYILENTDTHERISVKTIAEKKGDSDVIWSITSLYKCANLLEREVYDFLGIKFLSTEMFVGCTRLEGRSGRHLYGHRTHPYGRHLRSCPRHPPSGCNLRTFLWRSSRQKCSIRCLHRWSSD